MNNKSDFEPFIDEIVEVKIQDVDESVLALKLVKIMDLEVLGDTPENIRSNPFMLVFHGPIKPLCSFVSINGAFTGDPHFMLGIQAERIEEDYVVYTSVFN